MVALRVTGFSGVVPRRGARLLGQGQGQVAANCRLTSGYMEALKDGLLVAAPAVSAIRSVYKQSSGGNDYYYAWAADVNVARGPVAGDTTQRFYFTGDNEPRVSNFALATASAPYPNSWYVLGVTPPITAPGCSPAGGAGAFENRAYVYTFVTQWGEESAPSPASTVTNGRVDATWTVNNMDVAPLNSFVVTGAAWAAGVATLTVASTFGARVGETFDVTGMNPAGYNATGVKATAVTSTTISYNCAVNPGAFVAGGAIARKAPHNTTGMLKYIYRTVTDTSGVTSYRFVKSVAVATTSTTETVTSPTDALQTTGYLMPPVDMTSIVSMPNGMMAGLSGNQVCFCVAYRPYAWPSAYRYAMDFNGVSLGAFGNSVVATTEANPYVHTGTDPATVTSSKVDQIWPCVAKLSTVEMGFGVGYATDYGYALIGSGGAVLTTEGLYTEVEWQALVPSSMRASLFSGRVVISYSADGVSRQAIIIDKNEQASVTTANVIMVGLWRDPITGRMYYVGDDNKIYRWDANPGVLLSADWLSGEYVFPAPVNLGAAKLDADFTMTDEEVAAAEAAAAATLAANQALITALATKGSLNAYSVGMLSVNGSLLAPIPAVEWDSLVFSLYVNGALKVSKAITNSKSFRLPGTYKADNAAFRVSGNVRVKAIVVGETMKDLARA